MSDGTPGDERLRSVLAPLPASSASSATPTSTATSSTPSASPRSSARRRAARSTWAAAAGCPAWSWPGTGRPRRGCCSTGARSGPPSWPTRCASSTSRTGRRSSPAGPRRSATLDEQRGGFDLVVARSFGPPAVRGGVRGAVPGGRRHAGRQRTPDTAGPVGPPRRARADLGPGRRGPATRSTAACRCGGYQVAAPGRPAARTAYPRRVGIPAKRPLFGTPDAASAVSHVTTVVRFDTRDDRVADPHRVAVSRETPGRPGQPGRSLRRRRRPRARRA